MAMGGFKRFCMVCFALVGLLALAALALPWLGPWTDIAAGFMQMGWYLMVVEIFMLVMVVGFVVVFVKAVTAKKPEDVEVEANDGNTIYIARSAIASQATYLVEQDGTCVAQRVRVIPRKHDKAVDLEISVQPYTSIDIRSESSAISARLKAGITTLIGDRLGEIRLNFLEPRTTGDITPGEDVVETKDGYEPTAVHELDRDVRHAVGDAEKPVSYGIHGDADADANASSEVTIMMPSTHASEKE
jgi:uncharacterized membrane protein